MNPPDDTIMDILFKYAAGPIAAMTGYIWKKQGDDMQALESRMAKRVDDIKTETDRNREVAAKIFDKLDSMSRESADRHERLLNVIHSGLAGKADK